MPRYICSLPNVKKAGRVPELVTDDPAAIDAFIKKWDIAGRGVFECVSLLKDGATRRCRETVGKIYRIPFDVDFKALIETPKEIDEQLQQLPLRLTAARNSGGGRHGEFTLKEPADVEDAAYFERASTAIKQLATRLNADPAPTNPASLFRMPGTHNTKYGEPILVEQLWGSGQPVDLSEIETLIELLPETGLFTRKPAASNGHDRSEGEPRTTGEHEQPPRLEDIAFGNIHNTWKFHIGSELRNGAPADDVFHRLLQAAEQSPACQSDPGRRSWPRSLADLMTWYLRTEPDFVLCLPYEMQIRWHQLVSNGRQPRLIWRADRQALHVASGRHDDGMAPNNNPHGGDDRTGPSGSASAGTGSSGASAKAFAIPLTVNEWLQRNLPAPDRLLGDWLTTTSRILLSADTGLGKTNLGMAIAAHVAAAVSFLHWVAHRPARVLYIDGEMSGRLFKRRIEDVTRRLGLTPEGLFLFSREDVENFHPLNTPLGRKFLNELLQQIGGIDLVIFDNIMALLDGDMKDEEGWTRILPLVNDLTKRAIGQMWINHTGHDATRGYGSKTKEWRMDTTIHLTAIERSDVDLSFRLEFRKARERTPENRRDFEDVTMALVDDQWVGSETVKYYRPKEGSVDAKALEVLHDLLTSTGADVRGRRMVKSDAWREACARCGLIDGGKPISARTIFNRLKAKLVAGNLIVCEGDLVGERI